MSNNQLQQLTTTVLFEIAQSQIATLLNNQISNATKIKIIAGFVTVEGIKVIEDSLRTNAQSLDTFVIGAGTYKAFEALDQLISIGVTNASLFVHLGHTKLTTTTGARHSFYRYHPMLHSKIYYFEFASKKASAFIGSHNITGFALMGLNGEASIMIEGDINHPEFEKIRTHIDQAKNEAVSYQSSMKEGYAWWVNQFMEGLAHKTEDWPKEVDKTRTILLFCEYQNEIPKQGEVVYFELLEALGRIQSLSAEIHLFIFDTLPPSPFECLSNLSKARLTFFCSVEGVENNKGGKELIANWYVDNQRNPTLKRAPNPFRPNPSRGMQQIRVRFHKKVFYSYEYLFGPQSTKWIPILDEQKEVRYDDIFSVRIQNIKMIPHENVTWSLVKQLEPADKSNYTIDSPYYLALKAMEPDSGNFILFSTGRKKRD